MGSSQEWASRLSHYAKMSFDMSHSHREETIYKAFYFQSLARGADAWTPMTRVTYSPQVFVFLLLYCERTVY